MNPHQIEVIPFNDSELMYVSTDTELLNLNEQINGSNVIQRLSRPPIRKRPLQYYTLINGTDGTKTYWDSAGKLIYVIHPSRPIKAAVQWAPRLDPRAARCDSPFDIRRMG
jgi:hypothetical protein